MLTEYQRGSFFGAIIIAFAFAASFSTIQYQQYYPSHQATSDIERDKDKRETFWEAATSDPVAAFTGALVIVGGIQAALFLWQLDLIRKSLADTKEAADAAKLSAEVANNTKTH
jgi:hypothetical protein